jgi:phospholipid/cholesterol/gamma-HCH transport system substrate-binding protein
MNKVSMEAKVGLFFLVTAIVLAFIWFKILEFGAKEGFLLKAHFRSAEGLSQGAQVQIAGIKVGSVRDISLDPQTAHAVIVMEIDDRYRNAIPEDSRAALKSKGLLGDKYLIIEPGKPNARKLKPGETIKLVSEPPDTDKVFETVGVVAQDLQVIARQTRETMVDDKGVKKVDSILDNADAAFKNLNQLLARNKDKISQAVDSTDASMRGLQDVVDNNRGKLDRTIENLDQAAKGLSGLIVRNRDKIDRGVEDLQVFAQKMGVSGERVDRSTKEIEALARDIRSGRGTLGKLVSDDELYRNAQALLQDLRSVSSSLQSGDGTLSRLINDSEFYYDARRAIRNMSKTAEDVSEATPISTLAIILGTVFK